jgi:hypothetical protein
MSDDDLAEFIARLTRPHDADFALLSHSWPRLPEAIRFSIMLLVKAASE